jgi:four helix bundle protein
MQVKMQNAKCKVQNEEVSLEAPAGAKGANLSDRLVAFAVESLKLCGRMPRGVAGRAVAGQVVRCATSPGANCEEACGAESSADFIHKMQVVLKEVRESRYWLTLARRADLLPPGDVVPLIREADELVRIFSKSVVTAKRSAGARASPSF